MTTAEIVAIGTELLLGEIQDTNTRTLAVALRGIGLDLYRTSIVGDNQSRIAEAISDALARCEVVITSGGLGPTVDDVTREGIAEAFGLELKFRPDLWEQIEARFAAFGRNPTENNRRQAMLPGGATGIENPVGTAPAFIVERDNQCVIALPGVPAELEHLLNLEVLPYLRSRLEVPAVIKSRLLRTAGIGESWIDERIDDLERMTNPTVGLAAHPGRVDIRITAKAGTEMEADELLWGVEATVRQRLGDRVYGTDQQTLEQVVLELVRERDGSLVVVESGTGGALAGGLAAAQARESDGADVFVGGDELPPGVGEQRLIDRLEQERQQRQADAGLGLAVNQREDQVDVTVIYRGESGDWAFERSYGGAPPNAAAWAVSLALDQLRRHLLTAD